MAPSIWTIPEREFLDAYRARYEAADEVSRIILLESKIIPRFLAKLPDFARPFPSDDEAEEEDGEDDDEPEPLIKQKIRTWFQKKSPSDSTSTETTNLRGTEEERAVLDPYIELYRLAGETARRILITTRVLPDFVRRFHSSVNVESLSPQKRKEYKKYVTDWLIIEVYYRDANLSNAGENVDLNPNSPHRSPQSSPLVRSSLTQKRKIPPNDDGVVYKKQKVSSGVTNSLQVNQFLGHTLISQRKQFAPSAPPHTFATTALAAKSALSGDKHNTVSRPSLGSQPQYLPPVYDTTTPATLISLRRRLKVIPHSASASQTVDDLAQAATTAKPNLQNASLDLRRTVKEQSHVLEGTSSTPTALLEERRKLVKRSLEEILARQEMDQAKLVAAQETLTSQMRERTLVFAKRVTFIPRSSTEPESSVAASHQEAERPPSVPLRMEPATTRTPEDYVDPYSQQDVIIAERPSVEQREGVQTQTTELEQAFPAELGQHLRQALKPFEEHFQKVGARLQKFDDNLEALSGRLERMEERLVGMQDQLTKYVNKKKTKRNKDPKHNQTGEAKESNPVTVDTVDASAQQASSFSGATVRKAGNTSTASSSAPIGHLTTLRRTRATAATPPLTTVAPPSMMAHGNTDAKPVPPPPPPPSSGEILSQALLNIMQRGNTNDVLTQPVPPPRPPPPSRHIEIFSQALLNTMRRGDTNDLGTKPVPPPPPPPPGHEIFTRALLNTMQRGDADDKAIKPVRPPPPPASRNGLLFSENKGESTTNTTPPLRVPYPPPPPASRVRKTHPK